MDHCKTHLSQKRENRTQVIKVSFFKKQKQNRDPKGPTNYNSIHIVLAVLLLLTYWCLAGEHRGGQGAGRGAVQPGRSLDEVGRLLQKATGYPDVVNPQETAASEWKVPASVKVEHGWT